MSKSQVELDLEHLEGYLVSLTKHLGDGQNCWADYPKVFGDLKPDHQALVGDLLRAIEVYVAS